MCLLAVIARKEKKRKMFSSQVEKNGQMRSQQKTSVSTPTAERTDARRNN